MKRLGHCTPTFGPHSPLCDRDGSFCSREPMHDGPCSPHGKPKASAYDRAIAYATAEGERHGRNAADWYIMDTLGGRASGDVKARARAILAGIEDCDPAVLDTLPSPDLSGQWADTLTGPQLARDAIEAARMRHSDGSDDPDPFGHAPGACEICDTWDATGEICDAYDLAYSTAVEDAIATAARDVLADVCDYCGGADPDGPYHADCEPTAD